MTLANAAWVRASGNTPLRHVTTAGERAGIGRQCSHSTVATGVAEPATLTHPQPHSPRTA